MIEVGRTWLSGPIHQVEEELWDYLQDDSGLKYEDWSPRIDEESRWYISHHEGELVGAFLCRRLNFVTWEAHACVRPKFWGANFGTAHCQAALDLMFEDTGAKKIVAMCADCFPDTMRMTEAIGFRREGRRVDSFQRNGKLYDEVYLGIDRKLDE